MTFGILIGIFSGRISLCGISWWHSSTTDPHGGVVGTCQFSQDVCPGWQWGVTGLVVSRKREECQEEVKENGDEGQGQTDCPGATAHTPHHPAERRVRQRERERETERVRTDKDMRGRKEEENLV